MLARLRSVFVAYGQSEALHGISFEAPVTRSSRSWAATAWARPR
jgi:hypothetical protein